MSVDLCVGETVSALIRIEISGNLVVPTVASAPFIL